MTMKMYDTLLEDATTKSTEEVLDELNSMDLTVTTPDYVVKHSKPEIHHDEISLAFYITLKNYNLLNPTGEGTYSIDVSQLLLDPLQKILNIHGGTPSMINIFVPYLVIQPNDKLIINLATYIPHQEFVKLQRYDAHPHEIIQGLPFYTPTISNLPVYDEETNNKVEKYTRRIETILKVLSKGEINGTPYQMSVKKYEYNLNPVGVKQDGVIHIQDLVPFIVITVDPKEVGEQLQNRIGELLDIPKENIPEYIRVV